MMDTVATLDVKVTADASQFKSELSGVDSALDKSATDAEKKGAGIGRAFVAGAAIISGAAVTIGIAAFKTSLDWDDALKKIQEKAGFTADEIRDIGAAAQDMAAAGMGKPVELATKLAEAYKEAGNLDTAISSVTQKLKDENTGTLAEKLEALEGIAQNAMINIGTPLTDALIPIAEEAGKIAGSLGKWIAANPELSGQLLTLGVLALPVSIGIRLIAGAFGAVSAVLTSTFVANLVAVGAGLALPFIPIAAGIALVAGGFALLATAINDANAAAEQAKKAVTPGGDVANPGLEATGGFIAGQSIGGSTGAAPAGIMLQPSPDLVALEAMGYTPSSALEALAAGGLDPSTALELIAALGIPPELSLQTLVDDGLLPSSILEELQARGLDGSVTLMAAIAHGIIPSDELTALIAKGLTVTVNVPPVYQGVADRETIPQGRARARGGKAEAGETYIVGDGGEPEVLQMGANSGYITPLSDISGGRGSSGAPIIIQNLSIFANSVEELYDQIRGEAGRRGERMAYA